MDPASEIYRLQGDIDGLKEIIDNPQISEDERVACRNERTALRNEITALIGRLPPVQTGKHYIIS